MRHIPEEELHAYLDQALSRSQCIEIETHLARCAACRESRDDIAGLRDRTTAMLDRVAVRRSVPPPLEVLRAVAEERRRRARRRPAFLAASVAAALLGGWALRTSLEPRPPETLAELPPIVAEIPASDSVPVEPERVVVAEADPPPPSPSPPQRSEEFRPPTTEVRLAESRSRLEIQARLAPGPVAVLPVGLDGTWNQMTLVDAEAATGGLVPLIPNLPILGIQVRQGGAQQRPLVLVTQRYGQGWVHTIEGPVAEVAALVSGQLAKEGMRSSEPSRSPPDYLEVASGFRRTSRVLTVLGPLAADTLNTLAQSVVLR